MKQYIELKLLKENEHKRITLVNDLNSNLIYVKLELYTYNLSIWKTLQQLNLDHIPKIYELEEQDHALTIIQEYINAPTLDDYLKNHTFTIEEVKEIILSLCYILNVLHHQNPPIIHRDIKPDNIFYDHGKIYLNDFDIARVQNATATTDTELLGSQGYASPEQYGFAQTDARSDLYSLGVLMNVLLTKQFPSQKLWEGNYKEVIVKLTMIDPDARYRDVKEVIHDLKRDSFFNSLKAYALPGFRSNKLSNKIIATLSYIFICYVVLSASFETNNDPDVLNPNLERIWIFLVLIQFIAYCTNYLNIYKHCLFHRSVNKFHKCIGVIITYFIEFTVLLLIILIIDAIIKA